MSEYGVKIKNIRAGSLYEYNLGVRDKYDYVDALLTNSLFLDFLMANGLKVKNNSTKDIIDLDFNYSSKSYEEEKKKLERIKKETQTLLDKTENEQQKIKLQKKLDGIDSLIVYADNHKEKFIKKSKDDIRIEYYKDGVNIGYPTFYKDGTIKSITMYHYKMLYRSTGKAKKGSCIFIVDRLYKKARDFLYMGYKLPKHNAPIVEISAYASLVSSTIVGKIKINPENILVLKDVDSYMRTNVVSIETDENKHCKAVQRNNYELKNTIFDGQALIDESVFPTWGDGYVLLRHHMTKMAAFKSRIQQFYKDKFGHDYDTAIVTDMFGNEHYAKDIELITTDNALKWLKFSISYKTWCEKVHENGDLFGVVKTSHKSKLGDVQKMSYQMINALEYDKMENIAKCSIDYINQLKQDNTVFLEYLRQNVNFTNDFDVIIALCEQNPKFVQSEYFRERKKKIISAYVNKLKIGKVINNADNLTIVGNPYAMLLHSIGENVENDNCFNINDDYIECYTNRFDDGEFLAGFRSPLNSKNNILYLKNNLSSDKWKYFDFGEQIVAINMLHTDVQSRGNGLDMDSDSIYTTNQSQIVECAKEYYKTFPTVENNIPKDANKYDNTIENFALIDNKLAASQRAIGESSNLAQLAQTYMYSKDENEQKYIDYACVLAVLAQWVSVQKCA